MTKTVTRYLPGMEGCFEAPMYEAEAGLWVKYEDIKHLLQVEPPAKCTCQPLAQQLGVPFGLTAVAVDPECPVHREPAGKHEVVKYPDPPYELLGDSGKIHCPMCCGEGMVDPPSENRT